MPEALYQPSARPETVVVILSWYPSLLGDCDDEIVRSPSTDTVITVRDEGIVSNDAKILDSYTEQFNARLSKTIPWEVLSKHEEGF